MGALIAILTATLLVALAGVWLLRGRPRLQRCLWALPVGVGAWLARVIITTGASDGALFYAAHGMTAGVTAAMVAPRGVRWLVAPLPVLLIYGAGTLSGGVVWTNEGVPALVYHQLIGAFLGGVVVDLVKWVVARGMAD